MGYTVLPDGTIIYEDDDDKKDNNDNDGGDGGGGGGGDTSSKGLSKEQKEDLLRRLKHNYQMLYGGKWPPMPGGLITNALKLRYYDQASILDYLRKNARSQYQKTSMAKARANEVSEQIDSMFGENFKWKKAFVEMYVMADPKAYNWDKYLEKVVVRTKAFREEFVGWKQWYKKQGNKNANYRQAIARYLKERNDYLDLYRSIMGSDKYKLSKDIIEKAMTEGWTEDTFTNYVKQYDENYYTGGAPGTQDRENQIKNLWHTMYGPDSDPPSDLVEKFVRGSEKLETFFNSTIRYTQEFKDANPFFEDWALAEYGYDATGEEDAATGHEGRDTGGVARGMEVDPFDYFKQMREWKQFYEVLTEKPGVFNMELIRQAMIGHWSTARFELEFKKSDPAYTGTTAASNKQESFTKYWKSLFGADATPDKEIMDKFLRGNSDSPDSMFGDIRQTDEFQQQYADWDEFSQAQSAKGYGQDILDNPQIYKQYEDAFYREFQNVGIEPPEDWKGWFFSQGIPEDELSNSLNTWINTATSYQNITGQKADVTVAAGLKGQMPGADLRRRMEKALQQHRTLANSEWGKFDINKSDNGTLIKSI